MTKSQESPNRRDGAQTKQRIMQAAIKLFALQGFAQTTSKAIATEAKVDLASINYHFGSRNALYQRVLIESHRQLVSLDDLRQLEQDFAAPEDRFKAIVTLLFKSAAQESNWHTQVVAREILSPTSNIQTLFSEEVFPKFNIMKRLLSQLSGIPEASPKLFLCVVHVVAPCMMMLATRHGVFQTAYKDVNLSDEVVIAHIVQFSLGGLRHLGALYAEEALAGNTPET